MLPPTPPQPTEMNAPSAEKGKRNPGAGEEGKQIFPHQADHYDDGARRGWGHAVSLGSCSCTPDTPEPPGREWKPPLSQTNYFRFAIVNTTHHISSSPSRKTPNKCIRSVRLVSVFLGTGREVVRTGRHRPTVVTHEDETMALRTTERNIICSGEEGIINAVAVQAREMVP